MFARRLILELVIWINMFDWHTKVKIFNAQFVVKGLLKEVILNKITLISMKSKKITYVSTVRKPMHKSLFSKHTLRKIMCMLPLQKSRFLKEEISKRSVWSPNLTQCPEMRDWSKSN